MSDTAIGMIVGLLTYIVTEFFKYRREVDARNEVKKAATVAATAATDAANKVDEVKQKLQEADRSRAAIAGQQAEAIEAVRKEVRESNPTGT